MKLRYLSLISLAFLFSQAYCEGDGKDSTENVPPAAGGPSTGIGVPVSVSSQAEETDFSDPGITLEQAIDRQAPGNNQIEATSSPNANRRFSVNSKQGSRNRRSSANSHESVEGLIYPVNSSYSDSQSSNSEFEQRGPVDVFGPQPNYSDRMSIKLPHGETKSFDMARIISDAAGRTKSIHDSMPTQDMVAVFATTNSATEAFGLAERREDIESREKEGREAREYIESSARLNISGMESLARDVLVQEKRREKRREKRELERKLEAEEASEELLIKKEQMIKDLKKERKESMNTLHEKFVKEMPDSKFSDFKHKESFLEKYKY